MNAYKCDRCGGFYEDDSPKVLRRITEIYGRQVHGIAFNCGNNAYTLDFCPDCLTGFKEWYESGAAAKEQMK